MIYVDTREKIFQRYIYLSVSIILVIISSTRTTRVIYAKSIGDIHYLVEMEKRDEKKSCESHFGLLLREPFSHDWLLILRLCESFISLFRCLR